MNKVYVSGSLAFDHLMETSLSLRGLSFPSEGIATHSIIANSLFKNDGGTAANIAHNLSLLSIESKIFCSVGSDATEYLKRLSQKGVDVSAVTVVHDLLTASASALTDAVGNQVFFFCPGAMDIPSLVGVIDATWAIVAPGNHADMLAFPQAYRQSNTPYIYDPGQMIHSLSPDTLLDGMTGAHTLIMNEFEWGELSRKMNMSIEDALSRAEVLIVTRGEHGVSVYERDNQYAIPAVAVRSVDTMGAGDAFRAGYLYGLLHSQAISTAASLGNTLASFCVEVRGTQTHNPLRKNIEERYTQTYKSAFPEYTSKHE